MTPFCPCCGLSRPSDTALPLTPKQRRLLQYFEDRVSTGVSPSYDEIIRDLGYSSKSNISYHLSQLEDRGYIRRSFGRARSVVVLGMEANA